MSSEASAATDETIPSKRVPKENFLIFSFSLALFLFLKDTFLEHRRFQLKRENFFSFLSFPVSASLRTILLFDSWTLNKKSFKAVFYLRKELLFFESLSSTFLRCECVAINIYKDDKILAKKCIGNLMWEAYFCECSPERSKNVFEGNIYY